MPFFAKTANRSSRLAVMLLCLGAFLLRAGSLDVQSLWRDEVDVVRLAQLPLAQLTKSLPLGQHNGPVYYVLMQGWVALSGTTEFGLRFLSVCASVVAVPLAWRLARQLIGRRAALMATLLIVISPNLVWYAQDAKMYALASALTLLAMYGLWRGLATGRWWYWACFVLAASLALYIHMLSALLIPVYAAALPLSPPRYRTHWRGWLLSLALLTLPYIPLGIWQMPLIVNTLETGHPFYSFNQIVSLLLNLYARGVTLAGGWVVLAAFVFAMLMGLFGEFVFSRRGTYFRDPRFHLRLFLFAWLFVPMFLVYLISLRVPIFEPRYLIFAAPAFYLLAGQGLIVLSRQSRLVAGLVLAIIVVFNVLSLGVQATTPIKSDFRAAAAYVAAHYSQGQAIMLQMPYVAHIFDHYFEPYFVPLEGPWTNDDRSPEQVDEYMESTLASSSELWLVLSESWLWDSRELGREWLDAHGQLVDSANFTLVEVRRYQLADSH